MNTFTPSMGLAMLAACGLVACGGGGGDAVLAQAQSISLEAPLSSIGLGSTMVTASASSGLPVSYSSTTPSVCDVNTRTGEVSGLSVGTCTLRVTQRGDTRYAPAPPLELTLTVSTNPAQTLSFSAAPILSLGGLATVTATASSGLPVAYDSLSPAVCVVQTDTGLLQALSAGTCVVSANQTGDAHHLSAAQVTQALPVVVPTPPSTPGAPAEVTAQMGDDGQTVILRARSIDGGGRVITGYTAHSVPEGAITLDSATGTALPLTVRCPSGCAGHAFTLGARNDLGEGPASAPVDVITRYTVTTLFHEPDTQPRDSVFTGRFTVNATTGTVSELAGRLSESMTGDLIAYPNDTMNWLTLSHQLDTRAAPGGGLLVSTFRNASTLTFTTMFGGDGWTPEAGIAAGGIHAGFPVAANNPGNAYVRVFVNPADPTAPLTPTQVDTLAYADCAPGGMMGGVCMTGTSLAGHGAVGTMSGHPVSQVIRRIP